MWLRIIEARARQQREREGKLGKVRVPPRGWTQVTWGLLQFMGSQRVRHDLLLSETEQQQNIMKTGQCYKSGRADA